MNLTVRNLQKRFKDTAAVDNVSFEVKGGEILVLLGPSGCGKTTTLRAVAGLETPDSGDILIGDQLVFGGTNGVDLPPEKRGVGMVFQSYAVWPHMSVFDNVAFGLSIQNVSRAETVKRVANALDLVDLKGQETKYPHQLSGGQMQRVSLARSLVIEPKVLLFDEPLSNLDAKLREKLRFDIKQLQRRTGITSIYVTHDQAEAVVLADRLAVMDKGKIVQIATSFEIYRHPVSSFVADFVGVENIVVGVVNEVDSAGNCWVLIDGGFRFLTRAKDLAANQSVSIGIRPETINLLTVDSLKVSSNGLKGRIKSLEFLGAFIRYHVAVGDTVLVTASPFRHNQVFREGEEVSVEVEAEEISVWKR